MTYNVSSGTLNLTLSFYLTKPVDCIRFHQAYGYTNIVRRHSYVVNTFVHKHAKRLALVWPWWSLLFNLVNSKYYAEFT